MGSILYDLLRVLPAVFVGVTAGCTSSCSENHGDGMDASTDTDTDSDTDIDSDSDTDTDADSDSDSDTDTDTGPPDLGWDGGTPIPCEGDGGPDMVCVPGNTYLMGCMPYDTECESGEYPMVEVTLSPFWIDKYEATYEEIIPFLNTLFDGYERGDRYIRPLDPDSGLPSYELWASNWVGGPPIALNDAGMYQYGIPISPDTCDRGEEAAAGCMGWLGAKLYCEWRGMRLPTEAEWEAAARGQTKLKYPCAWYYLPCWYGTYDCCTTWPMAECYMGTCENCCIPLADNLAGECDSPYGVRQMYGNASEWVLDWQSDDHSWCSEGCTDPPPRAGPLPVIKGGSVGEVASKTRISSHTGATPWALLWGGVRCVLSPVSFEDVDAGQ